MVTKMSKNEWMARGRELFGDNFMAWKFVCPLCHHIQTPEDFREYQAQGATPDDATQRCIGIFSGFDHNSPNPKPCDYDAFGPFKLCPIVVVTERGERQCFGFHEPDKEIPPAIEQTIKRQKGD